MTITRQQLADLAMDAARHCVEIVVDGDPRASPDGFASSDRKNNAQAALALVQAARTLTLPPRRDR